MGRGSVAQRLVDFVQEGVGTVRGGLAVTTVGTRQSLEPYRE
jgi:C4-dicarboxylate transporter DctM subunit